jgi:hypothetical protein
VATAESKLNKWKGAKRHAVMLPSGTEVQIELPDLVQMIAAGEVPNALMEAASKQSKAQADESFNPETFKTDADYVRFILARTVKDPALEPADVDEIPYEDKQTLMEYVNRVRDTDLLGRQMGGLHTNAEFRKFRGLESRDSDSESQ